MPNDTHSKKNLKRLESGELRLASASDLKWDRKRGDAVGKGGYIYCPECGQPMLPAGMVKLPNNYDHAQGCPLAGLGVADLSQSERPRKSK